MILELIHQIKQHPTVLATVSVSSGWLAEHYAAFHDWGALALIFISIISGILAIHLQILKVVEKRNKIKYYKSNYNNEKQL